MYRFLLSVSLLVVGLALWMVPAEAAILRVDVCTKEYTKDQPALILQNEQTKIFVRGDLVDTATGILAPPGVSIRIDERKGGGGLNTYLYLTILAGTSAAIGDHNIKLNYAIEVGQPDIFKIRIKQVKINSISVLPHYAVQVGTPVTFTVNGKGLTDLKLESRHNTDFTNAQILTQSDTTLTFKGNALRSITGFFFVDSTLGPENNCNIVSHDGVGGYSFTVGKTDLTVSKAAGVYRFFPQPEVCAGVPRLETEMKFCTGSSTPLATPTAFNPHVEQVQNVGAIIYVVRNTRHLVITSPIKVQLRSGKTVLKQDILNGMAADGVETFTYSRPQNRRMLMRDIACLGSCYDLDVAPYNWRDPVYTTIVDVDNAVDEGNNESNNTATSD